MKTLPFKGDGEKRIRVNLNLALMTHRQFKALCAGRGWTLQDGLERAVQLLVKDQRESAAWDQPVEGSAPPWAASGAPVATAPVPWAARDRVPAATPVLEEPAPQKALAPLSAQDMAWARENLIDENPSEADMRTAIAVRNHKLKEAAGIEQARVAAERAQAVLEDEEDEEEEAHVVTAPITAKDFDVPVNWVDRSGSTRGANLDRYGEDEAIEYWPPIDKPHLDVDAPIVDEEDVL